MVAVDTNVLIYLHDNSDNGKRRIANNILAGDPKIPAQVISEYINVTRRILPLSKADILLQCASLFANCEIIPVSPNVLIQASEFIKRYDLQIFDSIIVAAAVAANCDILYSEDMHHGLVVNNTTILNPFI